MFWRVSIQLFSVIFFFEVISKIISSQLGLITRRIISPNQFGFIKVRQIQYCIVVAFDYVNSLGQKFYRGNMAMKIDIRKAFDTLCWDFHIYFWVGLVFLISFVVGFWLFFNLLVSILINESHWGIFRVHVRLSKVILFRIFFLVLQRTL